ncbi:MAG: Ni(II)/Co(II)-sensing metalloregulatory transcriptional repressor NmtR [Haliangiales bacterium]
MARVTRGRRKLPTDEQVERTVALFAALANPLRLRLLLVLSRKGAMSAGALQEAVGVEQSAVSHQLAALRRGRLVAVERDGRHMIYHLLDEHVAHIVEDAIKHANERETGDL